MAACPDDKYPNGLECEYCTDNCAVCDLVLEGQCSLCVASMYQYSGLCYSVCPDDLMVNLNKTLCVTPAQYALEYSKASKKIYFPFTIAAVIFIIVGIILKCREHSMHLATFLIAILAWVELGSWALFAAIEVLFYLNQQFNSLKSIICVGAGFVCLILTNLVFLQFYYRYISVDPDFSKWVRKHACANGLFLTFGTTLCFKIHRMIYSRLMDREEFSMVLSSANKLIPISVLSVISIFVSAVPVCVGASLALYYSLTIDQ